MFALFGIMTLIGSTKGEELLFKLSPIFIVALAVGYGVMIWNKKCIRNLKPEENKSEEELEAELKKIIAQVGATGPQDMGKVMGTATKALAGKAEGRMISAMVKKLL